MHHSFSTESFLKPKRIPTNYQPCYQHDITLPRQSQAPRSPKYKPTSDYFSGYPQSQSPQKSIITSNSSLSKLKKKIKQVKYALKIAQQHNEQLHHKLNKQKKSMNEQLTEYQKDVNKYKALYEMLIQNYEKKVQELNTVRSELNFKTDQVSEMKKIIKNYEKQLGYNKKSRKDQENTSNQKDLLINNNDLNYTVQSRKQLYPEQSPQRKSRHQILNYISSQQHQDTLKQLLTRQQVSLQHLTHENNLLREQLLLKGKKITEYEILLNNYEAEQKNDKKLSSKQLSELTAKVGVLQGENKRLANQKLAIVTKISRLQIELESTKNNLVMIQKHNQQLKLSNQQLEKQLSAHKQLVSDYESGQQKGKWKHLYDELNLKYNQVLKFNYDIQKEFEKQIHLMANQLHRREILKYSHR